MNLCSIKNRLEKKYYIGFNVYGTDNGFIVTLHESDEDKFQIRVSITDQVRLSGEVSIEKYGASFLHLINNSSVQKRKNFVDMIKSNTKGQNVLYINRNKCELDDFISNDCEWNDFRICFNELPFEYDENEVVRVLTLLIGEMLALFDYRIIGFEEGRSREVHCSKYERNPVNRQICLAYKGYKCKICGFDFEKVYGEAGKDMIEVHHIVPVSEMKEGYVVKPLEDLVPVCSNCHAIIHSKKKPYSVDDIKEMILRNNVTYYHLVTSERKVADADSPSKYGTKTE